MSAFDAVVLAGGGGRRLGGVDKARLLVGGSSMLQRVLQAVDAAQTVTVVGPQRPVPAPHPRLAWTLEVPPGGGPLAALATGLGYGTAETVVVAACDMPLLDADVVDQLVRSAGTADCAVLRDAGGRLQPLAAAYDRRRLTAALTAIGDPRDQPIRQLLDVLTVAIVPITTAARDVDTVADLAALRQEVAARDHTETPTSTQTHNDDPEKGLMLLTDWAEQVATALELDLDTDQELINRVLDLARDAAHSVARPAAPLTTFLVGYAAAQRGGGPDAIAACERLARELTQSWTGTDTTGSAE